MVAFIVLILAGTTVGTVTKAPKPNLCETGYPRNPAKTVCDLSLGKAVSIVAHGDVDEGCMFLHTSKNRTCCYMHKIRNFKEDNELCERIKQPAGCRGEGDFMVNEKRLEPDHGTCTLEISSLESEDLELYQAVFPGDQKTNKIISIKEIENEATINWTTIAVVVIAILVLLLGTIILLIRLKKINIPERWSEQIPWMHILSEQEGSKMETPPCGGTEPEDKSQGLVGGEVDSRESTAPAKYKVGEFLQDHEGTDVDILQKKLNSLPPSMLIFSKSLRALYNEDQVTCQEEETAHFLEVRNSVRQTGIVYLTKVLPMTEAVIRAIGFFADYFTDLDFDHWSECLEDIIGDIEQAIGVCDILKKYHSSISQDLKKNQDKATISITELTKMKDRFKVEAQQLMEKAQSHKDEAAKERDWGSGWRAFFSFGLTEYFSNKRADEADGKATLEHLEAFGRNQNADIAHKSVALVEGQLIPAVDNFISGLEVCLVFLSASKERLEKMKLAGAKGRRKPYYIMMKGRAGELNTNCLQFLAVTDLMRNDMAVIPSQPQDKNYVDKWVEEQQNQFAIEHPRIWNRIKTEVTRISSSVWVEGGWVEVNE